MNFGLAFHRLPAKARAAEIALPTFEEIAAVLADALTATKTVGGMVVPDFGTRLQVVKYLTALMGLMPENRQGRGSQPSGAPSWRDGYFQLGYMPETLDRLEEALTRAAAMPTKAHTPAQD